MVTMRISFIFLAVANALIQQNPLCKKLCEPTSTPPRFRYLGRKKGLEHMLENRKLDPFDVDALVDICFKIPSIVVIACEQRARVHTDVYNVSHYFLLDFDGNTVLLWRSLPNACTTVKLTLELELRDYVTLKQRIEGFGGHFHDVRHLI
jgi:hypothetical protein